MDFNGEQNKETGSWCFFVAKLMNCTYYFRHQELMKVLSKEVTHLEVIKQFRSECIETGL